MDKFIDQLISAINDDQILPVALLASLDIDEYLDARDANEEWLKNWNAAYRELKNISDDEIPGYDQLGQLIFSKCAEHVGITDLSCYTAEDFELLCKADKKGVTSEWLDELKKTYLAGSIPLLEASR